MKVDMRHQKEGSKRLSSIYSASEAIHHSQIEINSMFTQFTPKVFHTRIMNFKQE